MSCQGIVVCLVFFPKDDEKPMTYFEQRADIFVLKRSFSRDVRGGIGDG